eukprot:2780041-Amphidinium_carterae.1
MVASSALTLWMNCLQTQAERRELKESGSKADVEQTKVLDLSAPITQQSFGWMLQQTRELLATSTLACQFLSNSALVRT